MFSMEVLDELKLNDIFLKYNCFVEIQKYNCVFTLFFKFEDLLKKYFLKF